MIMNHDRLERIIRELYRPDRAMENMKQSLLEYLRDWLDSEHIIEQMRDGEISDPKTREETDLHIKMAEAAMKVFQDNCVRTKPATFI
jgi:hypothetical protein